MQLRWVSCHRSYPQLHKLLCLSLPRWFRSPVLPQLNPWFQQQQQEPRRPSPRPQPGCPVARATPRARGASAASRAVTHRTLSSTPSAPHAISRWGFPAVSRNLYEEVFDRDGILRPAIIADCFQSPAFEHGPEVILMHRLAEFDMQIQTLSAYAGLSAISALTQWFVFEKELYWSYTCHQQTWGYFTCGSTAIQWKTLAYVLYLQDCCIDTTLPEHRDAEMWVFLPDLMADGIPGRGNFV